MTIDYDLHKQQNRGRCELKEENLAPLRLQWGISEYFECLVRLRYEFTMGKYNSDILTFMVHQRFIMVV